MMDAAKFVESEVIELLDPQVFVEGDFEDVHQASPSFLIPPPGTVSPAGRCFRSGGSAPRSPSPGTNSRHALVVTYPLSKRCQIGDVRLSSNFAALVLSANQTLTSSTSHVADRVSLYGYTETAF